MMYSFKTIVILFGLMIWAHRPVGASTFTVTNTNDTGAGSFRDAIDLANTNPGADTIAFSPSLDGQSIALATSVNLTGDHTVILGDVDADQLPDISITTSTLFVTGSSNEVWTLNFRSISNYAIELIGDFNLVAGCYVGTTLAGNGASANGHGIRVEGSYNQIGGNSAAYRNVISGNTGYGILVRGASCMGNTILGNHIGTNAAGTAGLGNGPFGVYLDGSNSQVVRRTSIGDGTIGGRNVISSNQGYGVFVLASDSTYILGNYIGTLINGTGDLGNGQSGIGLQTVSGVWIGNGTALGRNVIAGNDVHGIYGVAWDGGFVIRGNFIGLAADGNTPIGNAADGIRLSGYNHQIGDGTTMGRNVIAGCRYGMYLTTNHAMVLGNYVGTDSTGSVARANQKGIVLGAAMNAIGDGTPGGINVLSGNTTSGIELDQFATSNTIRGNYIGVGSDGTSSLGNGYFGLLVNVGADSNLIGIESSSDIGNVISGNSAPTARAAFIASRHNQINGNFIGLDATGLDTVFNNDGMWVSGDSNRIGNGSESFRNVFSGNSNGLAIQGKHNRVRGNYFGTNAGGTAVLGNGRGIIMLGAQENYIGNSDGLRNVIVGSASEGVYMTDGSFGNEIIANDIGIGFDGAAMPNSIGVRLSGGAHNNRIGLDDEAEGNRIAHNATGIRVDGPTTHDNLFSFNSIWSNGTGIVLLGGSQRGVAPPRIQQFESGIVSGAAAPMAVVHLYQDDDNQGRYFLDTVKADGSGQWSRAVNASNGLYLTALQDSAGNSSSFSDPVEAILENFPGRIYWVDYGADKIRRAKPNGVEAEDVLSGLSNPDGIAFDGTHRKMYWSDRGTRSIHRANFDGSDAETLVTMSLLEAPMGMAVDAAGGKIYWVSQDEDAVRRANLDGSGVEVIVSNQINPGGVAVDPISGKVFWTMGGDELRRANLDGTMPETIVNGLSNAWAIDVDPVHGKVYVATRQYATIFRCNLDGTSLETVVEGLGQVEGLAVDPHHGKLYWTDIAEGRVRRSNLDGSSREGLVSGGHVYPSDIAVLWNPEPPQDVTAIQDGNAAYLSWTPSEESNVIGYRIYRSNAPGASALLDSSVGTSYHDTSVIDGTTYYYRITAVNDFGLESSYSDEVSLTITIVGVDDAEGTRPDRFELFQNYPNPFNPSTTIRFGLPQMSRVRLVLYNVLGQQIRELVNGQRSAGFHTAVWDGRDERGMAVASGLYFYRLESEFGAFIRRMTFLK